MRVDRFNLICRIIALTWLLIALPISQIVRTRYDDFPQYYVGAMAAAANRWDVLYPIPLDGAFTNAGFIASARPKEGLTQLAAQHGMTEVSFYFIQLPPVALMILPLGYLRFDEAHALWTLFCAACAAVVVLQLEHIARHCLGRQTYTTGVIVLAAALCPSMYRSVRVSNVSTIVPALLGWAALDLLRADGPRAAIPIVLATVMKYVGALFVPLAIIIGRWKTVVWSGVLTIALFAVTAMLSGVEVFREWATRIAPTLGRGTWQVDNQCIEAFLLRMMKVHPLPSTWQIGVRIAAWTILATLLLLIFRRRRSLLLDKPAFFAAAASLVAWMMIFSPICWNHYIVYLFPFWGWLAYELTRGWVMRIAAAISIVFALVPTTNYKQIAMPEPFNSHIMASVVIMLIMAVARLIAEPQISARRAASVN